MSFMLKDFDDTTREYALKEVEMDISQDKIYKPDRLSTNGLSKFPDALYEALSHGSPETLTSVLSSGGFFNPTENYTRSGKLHSRAMNMRAPQTLAEGEFNRYYIRGLAARAIAEGKSELEIYRARYSENPRPESEARIGVRVSPQAVLDELRQTPSKENPPTVIEPNSGLSLKLP